jgi:hypothetical protein
LIHAPAHNRVIAGETRSNGGIIIDGTTRESYTGNSPNQARVRYERGSEDLTVLPNLSGRSGSSRGWSEKGGKIDETEMPGVVSVTVVTGEIEGLLDFLGLVRTE